MENESGLKEIRGRAVVVGLTGGIGASAAVAAKYLARSGPLTVAIIGAGNQGQSTLQGLDCVLDIAELRVADLDVYARREMPLFMVPSAIVAVDHIPRNPNGKIDRKRLQEVWQAAGGAIGNIGWDNQEVS